MPDRSHEAPPPAVRAPEVTPKKTLPAKPDYGIDAPGVDLGAAGKRLRAAAAGAILPAIHHRPGHLHPGRRGKYLGRAAVPGSPADDLLLEGRQDAPARPHAGDDPLDGQRKGARRGHRARPAADRRGEKADRRRQGHGHRHLERQGPLRQHSPPPRSKTRRSRACATAWKSKAATPSP